MSGSRGWFRACPACRRNDRSDEQRGFVADAAGGVLVDGEGVEAGRVQCFAGVAHRGGEVGKLARRESALENGHQEGSNLRVADFVAGGELRGVRSGQFLLAVEDHGVDEVFDFRLGQFVAVALLDDDVEWMQCVVHGVLTFCAAPGKKQVLRVAQDDNLRKVFKAKGVGEKLAERSFFGRAVLAGIEDEGMVAAELGEGLAAGAAGHRRRHIEVGDGDGAQTDARAVLGDGARDGTLLGATGEAVGAVFDVAAGDDRAVFEQQGRSDAEVRVGRVGVLGGGFGKRAELNALLGGYGFDLCCLRHGESFRVDRWRDEGKRCGVRLEVRAA